MSLLEFTEFYKNYKDLLVFDSFWLTRLTTINTS